MNEIALVLLGLAFAAGAVCLAVVLPIVGFVRTSRALREVERAHTRIEALARVVQDLARDRREAYAAAAGAEPHEAPVGASDVGGSTVDPRASSPRPSEPTAVEWGEPAPPPPEPLADAAGAVAALASDGVHATSTTPPETHRADTASAAFEAPVAHFPSPPARRPPPPTGPRVHGPSLEQRIGKRWLLYVGIGAIVLGASYLVKLAFDNEWITPAMRVGLIALGGGVLVAIGLRFADRGMSGFGHLLAGGGIAVLYVSIYARAAPLRTRRPRPCLRRHDRRHGVRRVAVGSPIRPRPRDGRADRRVRDAVPDRRRPRRVRRVVHLHHGARRRRHLPGAAARVARAHADRVRADRPDVRRVGGGQLQRRTVPGRPGVPDGLVPAVPAVRAIRRRAGGREPAGAPAATSPRRSVEALHAGVAVDRPDPGPGPLSRGVALQPGAPSPGAADLLHSRDAGGRAVRRRGPTHVGPPGRLAGGVAALPRLVVGTPVGRRHARHAAGPVRPPRDRRAPGAGARSGPAGRSGHAAAPPERSRVVGRAAADVPPVRHARDGPRDGRGRGRIRHPRDRDTRPSRLRTAALRGAGLSVRGRRAGPAIRRRVGDGWLGGRGRVPRLAWAARAAPVAARGRHHPPGARHLPWTGVARARPRRRTHGVRQRWRTVGAGHRCPARLDRLALREGQGRTPHRRVDAHRRVPALRPPSWCCWS